MTATLFSAGPSRENPPSGDTARQAIHALGGYVYQVLCATLAWIDVAENERLYLEVAEDFALVSDQAIEAVQVKDTIGSGTVTLNTEGIRKAIEGFVDLVGRNPDIPVRLQYFTTSEIGTERALPERLGGVAGLQYWRKAAAGADVTPLREFFNSEDFSKPVRDFVQQSDDDALRADLLAPIHWNCGQPPSEALQQELENRLIVLARDQFGIAAQEVRQIANHLAYTVLKTSTEKSPQQRVLTRGDLYTQIDAVSRISMRRSDLDTIIRQLGALVPAPDSGTQFDADTHWLLDGGSLVSTSGLLSRTDLRQAIARALETEGICIVIGATGVGKTQACRHLSAFSRAQFIVADFRDLDAVGSRRRLTQLLTHIGPVPGSMIHIEDLNHIDDPKVSTALGLVIQSIRRRDQRAIVTCYRRPSSRALTDTGLTGRSIVDCPYLAAQEVSELVEMHGGDASKWARLAFIVGSSGHPQLTHAFILGMQARGWSDQELSGILERGLTTEDIAETRVSARITLLQSFPEEARQLLYKLSLTIGHFDRRLALDIARPPPEIRQAGEQLDRLIGPWIEVSRTGSYRVSPLASTFGKDMLNDGEQIAIHRRIADHLSARQPLDADLIDTILLHSLSGHSPMPIVKLAHGIIGASLAILRALGDNSFVLRILRTDSPAFPADPVASTWLRLAQFKLVAASADNEKLAAIAKALIGEIDTSLDSTDRRLFEGLAIATILMTPGIANFIDDWLPLLNRLHSTINSDPFLSGLRENFAAGSLRIGQNPHLASAMFSVGTASLSSVAKLERVFRQLDDVDPAFRALLLEPVGSELADYGFLVRGAWLEETKVSTLNADDAANRYRTMAEIALRWGNTPLALQCSLSRLVMIDEYKQDSDAALAELGAIQAQYGPDPAISRAAAQLFFRRKNYSAVLEAVATVIDAIGKNNSVERTYALRQAAISAGMCGNWPQSEAWLLQARATADSSEIESLKTMAIGLGADAAVAALNSENTQAALQGLSIALTSLSSLKHTSSLNAEYVHRVVRHTVLWAKSVIDKRWLSSFPEAPEIQIGCCSNPEPPAEIVNYPLGNIDIAFYMLAEAEAVSGFDCGIGAALASRLGTQKIPPSESELRWRRLQLCIERCDAMGFATQLGGFVEAFYWLHTMRDRLKSFNPLDPIRSALPAVDLSTPVEPIVSELAIDAILAFIVSSSFTGDRRLADELRAHLAVAFPNGYPGRELFDRMQELESFPDDLNGTVLLYCKRMMEGGDLTATAIFKGGLRIFERILVSPFANLLCKCLARWFRSQWKRIISLERFRIYRPSYSVPRIEAALAGVADDKAFVATLLLAADEAVGSPLDRSYIERLSVLAVRGSAKN